MNIDVNNLEINFCGSINKDIDSKNNKLRAAIKRPNKWDQNSTIKIAFLNKPKIRTGLFKYFNEYFYQQSFDQLYDLQQLTPDKSEMDPLEEEFRNLEKRKGGLKENVIPVIKQIIMERFQPYVNLKFVFIDDPEKIFESDILIEFRTGKGCSSQIGIASRMYGPKQGLPSLTLSWFSVQTVLHEFGHALGMVHEHQNPNNNNPIEWNKDAVIAWVKKTQNLSLQSINDNILSVETHINGSEFDPYSIMLYTFPAELTKNNKTINSCMRLSKLDVEWLSKTYPPSQTQLDLGLKQMNELNVKSRKIPVYENGRMTPEQFLKWAYPDQYYTIESQAKLRNLSYTTTPYPMYIDLTEPVFPLQGYILPELLFEETLPPFQFISNHPTYYTTYPPTTIYEGYNGGYVNIPRTHFDQLQGKVYDPRDVKLHAAPWLMPRTQYDLNLLQEWDTWQTKPKENQLWNVENYRR